MSTRSRAVATTLRHEVAIDVVVGSGDVSEVRGSPVRTLTMECSGIGVTANLVSPGMIATDEVREMVMRRAARDGQGDTWAQAERWALDNSMPNLTERIPAPEDIGRVVAFVASEAAWHVNGADLAVDGGARDA